MAVHGSVEEAQNAIARNAHEGSAITAATNNEARELNLRIRAERAGAGLVDDDRPQATRLPDIDSFGRTGVRRPGRGLTR